MGSLKTMGAPMLASVGPLDHLAARNSWSASSLCGRIPRPPSRVARAIRSSDKPLQEQSLVKSCTIGFRVTLNPCQRVVDRGYNCISHDGLTWILPYPPQTKLANEIRRLAQLSAKRV